MLGLHLLDAPLQLHARRRQPHGARGALQKLHAQRFLQLAHALAQRRLTQMQPLRGASEVQFLGDHREHLQQAAIDQHLFSWRINSGRIRY
ncbi:hypothetical protein D3C72_1212540 [compost metagenome]